MGTLFSAFDIARSGMATAQVQLDVVGHNIANVNKEGFSRQRVELVSNVPINRAFGQIGRGVRIDAVAQIRDVFLDSLYRRQVPSLADAEVRNEFLTRIEDIFLEPGPNGLSQRLNLFFESLNEYSTNVESLPTRQSVVTEAQSLANLFGEVTERLRLLRTNANEEIVNFVPEINALAERIGAINAQIRTAEAGGNPANDLRDDRGVLLDRLARLVNIFTRERSDGTIDVLVSGNSLVGGTLVRTLEAVRNSSLDPERTDLVEVRYADNGTLLNAQNGELFAVQEMRDDTLVRVDNSMDTLAATIIEQINRIHTQARGLNNLTGTVSSTNVNTLAGTLPFTVQDGSFDVLVYDATGAIVGTSTIPITAGVTTPADIVAALNAVNPNLSATLSGTTIVNVTAAAGFSFSMANDTSGILTSLGFGGLFTGIDARTIGVNQDILDDPRLLASGFDPDPLNTGDNSAALAMADVRNGQFLQMGSATINDFYESTIVQLGIEGQTVDQRLEVETTFVEGFERRRQEVSGVSLDEEVSLLLQFQRAFEASARVVTVTDRMLAVLLSVAQ